ncbi:hypothetical protein [Nocardia sp. NPDC056100]|uniref:hypothetical protein n=1 Tax=Nocardia sp. NPDC056100 TaxID=3345712 RepID=UPI0035E215E5
MDAHTADNPASRRVPKAAIWAVGVVAVLCGIWGIKVWFTPETEESTYLDRVTVAHFEKIAQEGSMSALPSARAFYVGPPVDDVSQIISAPGLSVALLPPSSPSPSQVDLLPGQRNYVSVPIATGRWSNGCALSISREIDTPYYEDKMTMAQIAGIKDGSVYALLIVATCGKG